MGLASVEAAVHWSIPLGRTIAKQCKAASQDAATELKPRRIYNTVTFVTRLILNRDIYITQIQARFVSWSYHEAFSWTTEVPKLPDESGMLRCIIGCGLQQKIEYDAVAWSREARDGRERSMYSASSVSRNSSLVDPRGYHALSIRVLVQKWLSQ